MKFENLSATMQNAVLNGAKIIAHGDSSFNVHIGSAQHTGIGHDYLCHSCNKVAEEDEYDVIPVEFPEEFPAKLNLSEALVRIMAAKTVVKRLYLDAVRAGESGMDALTILFALENGRSDGYTNEDDRAWSEFVISQRNRALIAVTSEKSAAFRAQQQQEEKL